MHPGACEVLRQLASREAACVLGGVIDKLLLEARLLGLLGPMGSTLTLGVDGSARYENAYGDRFAFAFWVSERGGWARLAVGGNRVELVLDAGCAAVLARLAQFYAGLC